MAGTIGLVVVLLAREAIGRLVLHLIPRVDVPIRHLRRSHARDDLVDLLFQLRIALLHEHIRSPFDHLVRIGIIEDEFPFGLAVEYPRSPIEVAHPAVDVALLEIVRDGFLSHDFESDPPRSRR